MKRLIILLSFLLLPQTVGAEDLIKPDFSLNGDMLYLLSGEVVSGGVGLNVASAMDGLIELRAEYVETFSDTVSDKIGAGIGINIPKLVEKAGGKWLVSELVPSIGVLGLLDLSGTARLEGALYLSVVKIEF